MELFLDDRKLDNAPDPAASLEEVLGDVRQTLSGTDRIIVGIRCDGVDLADEELTASLPRSVATFDRIEMQSAEPVQLVCEALESAEKLLDQSADQSAEVADMLTQGASSAALEKLGQCCVGWQRVHQTIVQAITMLQVDPSTITGETDSLATLLATPTEFLQQIKDGLTNADFVTVADVLRYELEPALDAWRKMIKQVRQVTSTGPAGQ